MQRVNRTTAVAVLPNPPAAGTPGFFAAPDPQGGVPATVPGYEWYNAIQEELAYIIEQAGLELSGSNNTQLRTSIVRMIADALSTILVQNNTWAVAQRGAIATLLADTATVAVDLSRANNFSLALAGNRTLGNPSNIVSCPGQSGIIAVTQDATGGRTLAYSSYYKFASGTAPTLTTTANAVDYLSYYVESDTRIFIGRAGDVK